MLWKKNVKEVNLLHPCVFCCDYIFAVVDFAVACVQVPDHMWCPTSLVVNGKETEYPVPEPYLPLNFINSTGMRYEAEEVRQCLLKGTGDIVHILIDKRIDVFPFFFFK